VLRIPSNGVQTLAHISDWISGNQFFSHIIRINMSKCTIYVGNLDSTASGLNIYCLFINAVSYLPTRANLFVLSENDVQSQFEKFGIIKQFAMNDQFAYIQYEKAMNAKSAVKWMNGTSILSKKLRVHFSNYKGEKSLCTSLLFHFLINNFFDVWIIRTHCHLLHFCIFLFRELIVMFSVIVLRYSL
jgi:RNA recognition motif-containing protein